MQKNAAVGVSALTESLVQFSSTPQMPALSVLNGAKGRSNAEEGATFLSELFFYSASISASKRVPSTGHRYALRVNPSPGNLHPTDWDDRFPKLSLHRAVPATEIAPSNARSEPWYSRTSWIFR